jgi:4-hydroxybenzoate polyprenyltransferase
MGVNHIPVSSVLLWRLLLGFLATGLIASSNYVLNEVLDAPYDRLHPIKKNRPVACGLVNIPVAYSQWLVLMIAGLALAAQLATPLFTATLFVLWTMGCIYNIPPIRSKDIAYVDVLSESINNPLRMLAGWYIATATLIPPVSLLFSYWMIGCYLMALKRFSELREIRDRVRAGAYRKSFRRYTERSLLVSVTFYGAAAMLGFGAFIARYRLELALAFPLVALVMAVYYNLAFDENSAAQNPEGLHRHAGLMASVAACTLAMTLLMFVDVPLLQKVFPPTMPTVGVNAKLR